MLQDVPFKIASLNWYPDISLSVVTEVWGLTILAEALILITGHLFCDNSMQIVVLLFLFFSFPFNKLSSLLFSKEKPLLS